MKIKLSGQEGVTHVEVSNYLIERYRGEERMRREKPREHHAPMADHLLEILRERKGCSRNSQRALMGVYSGDYSIFLEMIYRSRAEEIFLEEVGEEEDNILTTLSDDQERNRPPPCMGVDDGISIMRN